MNNKLAQIEMALNFAGIEYDDVIEGVSDLVKAHVRLQDKLAAIAGGNRKMLDYAEFHNLSTHEDAYGDQLFRLLATDIAHDDNR